MGSNSDKLFKQKSIYVGCFYSTIDKFQSWNSKLRKTPANISHSLIWVYYLFITMAELVRVCNCKIFDTLMMHAIECFRQTNKAINMRLGYWPTARYVSPSAFCGHINSIGAQPNAHLCDVSWKSEYWQRVVELDVINWCQSGGRRNERSILTHFHVTYLTQDLCHNPN